MKCMYHTAAMGVVALALAAFAEEAEYRDIAYRDDAEVCRLDIRHPKGADGFATYVFFHGGGLTAGSRQYPYWPEGDETIAKVAVGYRFLQDAPVEEVIDDAARAVAWVLDHIAEYGGDPSKVFVGGHSAGGYLTCMIGMDSRWLGAYGHSPTDLKGLIPVSGQVTEHFNVRKFAGDEDNQFLPKVNELSPLAFVDRQFAPMCSICGDRKIEWYCRVEENEFMMSSIRHCGRPHELDEFHECPGRDHGSVAEDAPLVSRAFVRRVLGEPVCGAELWKESSAMWQTPTVTPVPSLDSDNVRAIMIDGEPYHGKPTRFFAFCGIPEGASPTNRVPGIVLIHGGGGTAFPYWVETWVKRGYAAIAMDNCGGYPFEVGELGGWLRHAMSGPSGWDDSFLTVNEPLRDQWTYHAVSTVIRSHSYLRSLPEVDPERIGVTGISWGGYLTSCVIGIDDRFLFAAPVYGCGHLYEHSIWRDHLVSLGTDGRRWDELWDPRNYLSKAAMPVLWATGSNDFAYPLDSLQQSYDQLSEPPYLSIKIEMPHGHPPAGDPPEITAFADHYAFGRPALPRLTADFADGEISLSWDSCGRDIVKAELVYTASSDTDWPKRPFAAEPIDFTGTSLKATPPADATLFWVNLTDSEGLVASSRHFVR